MKIKSLKTPALIALFGVLYTVLIGLGTTLFFRHLGELLAALAPTLGLDPETGTLLTDIFGQLQTADLTLPLLGILLCLCLSVPILLLGRKHKVAAVLLLLLLLLPLTLGNIWFTTVNDIRFDRVVAQLVPLLSSGIL